MQVANEIRLGKTKDREIFWGSLLGAAVAAIGVWFLTVVVFSLA